MSLLIKGTTTLYSVHFGHDGKTVGSVEYPGMTGRFVAKAKLLENHTATDLQNSLHYAAAMYVRIVKLGLNHQLCDCTWLSKGRYLTEYVLPNNKRYKIVLEDSDSDAEISVKIDQAYAPANGAYSPIQKKQAIVTALRALL